MPDLPTTIETPEDYVNVCENFILPLFYEQSKKIVGVIKDLHKTINDKDTEQEKIDLYINKIKELAAFANENSPMNPYFQLVADLEAKFEEQGLFKEEDT
jgi:hypothetical protein